MTTSNEIAPVSTATQPWRSPWPVAALLAALTLSSMLLDHRRVAQADDVRWILAPTVSLASLATGEPFEWERGSGYLHRPTNVTITEGCSGLGFLAVCLVLIVARGAWHARSWQAAWRSLAGGCMAAAVIALITNATRIGLALHLAQADLTPWKLSFRQAHELESRIVYGTALVFLVLGLSWRTGQNERRLIR